MAADRPTPPARDVPIGIAVQDLLPGRAGGLIVLIVGFTTPLIAASLLLDHARYDEPRSTAMSFMAGWGPSLELPGSEDSPEHIAATAAVWIVGMAVVSVIWAVGVRGLDVPPDGSPTPWTTAIRSVLRRPSPVLGLGFLVGVGTTVAYFLLFVPGVVVTVGWFIAFPVLVLEGTGGAAALRRSWWLIRPRWWRTFGQILLVTLFLGLTHALVVLVPATLLAESGESARFIGALVTEVASAVITGVGYIALAVVLYDRLCFEERERGSEASEGVPTAPTYEPLATTDTVPDGHRELVELDPERD